MITRWKMWIGVYTSLLFMSTQCLYGLLFQCVHCAMATCAGPLFQTLVTCSDFTWSEHKPQLCQLHSSFYASVVSCCLIRFLISPFISLYILIFCLGTCCIYLSLYISWLNGLLCPILCNLYLSVLFCWIVICQRRSKQAHFLLNHSFVKKICINKCKNICVILLWCHFGHESRTGQTRAATMNLIINKLSIDRPTILIID